MAVDISELSYELVTGDTELASVVSELSQHKLIGLDIETTGLDPHSVRVLLVQIATPYQTYVIDALRTPLDRLRPYLEDPSVRKVIQNAKFEYEMFNARAGITLTNMVDTMLAERLLTAGKSRRISLKEIAFDRLDIRMNKETRESFVNMRGGDDAYLEKDKLEYAARDAAVMLPIWEQQERELMAEGLMKVAGLEFRAVASFGDLELSGSKIDVEEWRRNLAEVGLKKKESERELAKVFGPVIVQSSMFEDVWAMNFNSNIQIIRGLAKLGVDLPDTRERTLEEHVTEHPAIEKLIEYRGYQKAISSFGENLLGMINPTTGRLHANYNQYGADTGRSSSSEPNLQNIPKDSSFRHCFIAEPGNLMVACDFAAQELRLLGELSGDVGFYEAFSQGRDLHTMTATRLFGVPEEAVTKEMRFRSKCFHPGTEVLTKTGWKRIVDLADGEEVAQAIPGSNYKVEIEWAVPLEHFTARHPSGQLVHLSNYGIDIRVTPDHRMLAYGSTSKPYVVMPDKIPQVRGWVNAGLLANGTTGQHIDTKLLRLAVATQADGSYSRRAIRFGFSRVRKIERMRFLLDGLDYSESVTSNGSNGPTTWFCIDGDLALQVRDLLDEDKTLPWWWLGLSPTCRDIVLNEVAFWDGYTPVTDPRRVYFSSIKKNVDVLQALASTSGHKSRIRIIPPSEARPTQMYELRLTDHASTRGESVNIQKYEYLDEVACLSVPSTFVLVRDNGIPLICGQTLGFGMVYGMGPQRLASNLKIGIEEARDLIDKYFQSYRGVKRWIDQTGAQCLEEGWSATILGRKRYLAVPPESMRRSQPEDYKRDMASARRQGVNHAIQGAAADMTKIALVYVRNALKGRNARMVNMVHDEIVVECPADDAEEIRSLVEAEMVRAGQQIVTSIPVAAEAVIAPYWSKG